jgi:hypothetical protein
MWTVMAAPRYFFRMGTANFTQSRSADVPSDAAASGRHSQSDRNALTIQ